jgi:hypothetical protein
MVVVMVARTCSGVAHVVDDGINGIIQIQSQDEEIESRIKFMESAPTESWWE